MFHRLPGGARLGSRGGRDADDGGGDGGGILEAMATLGDTPADYRLEEPLHRQRVARDPNPAHRGDRTRPGARQPRRTVRRKRSDRVHVAHRGPERRYRPHRRRPPGGEPTQLCGAGGLAGSGRVATTHRIGDGRVHRWCPGATRTAIGREGCPGMGRSGPYPPGGAQSDQQRTALRRHQHPSAHHGIGRYVIHHGDGRRDRCTPRLPRAHLRTVRHRP